MKLTYHSEAEAEFLEAARFYERQTEGLGDRFLHELDAAIESIKIAPDRCRVVSGDVRRYVMRQFPYGIYYRVQDDELRILVIKHHSRHPDYGKDRFDD
jgi:toxin ParE1/3/4